LDLTGYWPDINGHLYSGSDSSSTAIGMPVTAAVDSTVRRPPSVVALPTQRSHPPASRSGTVDSQYASMSTTTTSTASASSNIDDDDEVEDDDDVTPSGDDVIQFIESPV